MLAIILWTIGVYIGLSLLDALMGNYLFPGKVGIVEVNAFKTKDDSKIRVYKIYKDRRIFLFFSTRKWFTTLEGGPTQKKLKDPQTTPYDLAQYVDANNLGNLNSFRDSFYDANIIPGDRLDLALILAKIFSGQYSKSDILEDRSKPVEIWNSRQEDKKKQLSEEDTLTLKLGEALRDNNQVEVLNLTQELKEKKYI